MTEERTRSWVPVVGRALLVLMIGTLAGAGLNAMLDDKGADTPVLALLGGALAFVAVLVRARRRAEAAASSAPHNTSAKRGWS